MNMIPLDALSSLVDAIINFFNAVINAILVIGVGIFLGIIIAIIIGFVVLGIIKARDKIKKNNHKESEE